ncbi:hypothetical protein L2E82_13008 [Cichorium intybus]|uniref:Uncharacterized protein n=1 Tax=Cichorium intybus TaxID=13427 RepID=A0ACB9GHK5_CICIN|nr:hypothetical protein L2E82_13008 [Cichorium intybus]
MAMGKNIYALVLFHHLYNKYHETLDMSRINDCIRVNLHAHVLYMHKTTNLINLILKLYNPPMGFAWLVASLTRLKNIHWMATCTRSISIKRTLCHKVKLTNS